MAGFTFRARESGGAPTILELTFQDTETITKGDIVNIESGLADLAATNDDYLAGVALETVAGTTAVSKIRVIVDEDALYGVVDANARLVGATLDISGATGAQTVTTSSNKDFVVARSSSATEETLVRINPNHHWSAGTAIA